MTEMTIFNVQRAVSQKASKPDLPFYFFCRSPHGASHSCKVYKNITGTVILMFKDP